MRFLRIGRRELPRWQSQLQALEHTSVYPLGQDAFRIDHGADYFAFFERMGEVSYYALEEAGTLVAVGCGVLRPAGTGLPQRWYVADVKVHPAWRGRHLVVELLAHAFLVNYAKCARGYAVAMDPSDGRTPAAVRSVRHFPWLRWAGLRTLLVEIWSADEVGMARALEVLVPARGRPRFLSLQGVKELRLESSGRPMQLLHASWSGRAAPKVFDSPTPGATHMWCTPARSALSEQLNRAGLTPMTTATVVAHRLPGLSGDHVETAEI